MTDSTLLAAAELTNYINGFKLLPIVVLGTVWFRLITWADKDAANARLPRPTINMINLGGLFVGLALLPIMPNYAAALGVFVFCLLAEVGYYLLWRNNTVGLADLKGQFNDWIKGLGRKKTKEVKATEGGVILLDRSGKPYPPPPDEDPARAAFDALQGVFAGPIKLNAQKIELRPSEGGSVLRYTVDGVTFEGKSFSKENAAAAIELAKILAGLDPNDRRKPQTGKMKVALDKARKEIDVYTAGSTAGELMRLTVDFKKQFDLKVETLGFLPDQEELMLNTIADPTGVVILTAPDQQGLTNLCYAVLKRHDAFLLNIQTLERDPAVDLEGITQNKIAPNAPAADESKQVSWMISQEPDVILIDRIDDPRSAIDLARFAQERRTYVAMRAPTTFDALAQWRKLVGDDDLATNSLKLVVAGRLVRLLCEACKVAYAPNADALRKMNMQADRVDKLFQARKEPMRDQKGNEIICPFCHGLAYKGRTGVFEMFKIDDDVRKAVLEGGTVNQLKALFRKQKQRYLQESALARVELGDTSVEEVLRVLRSQASTPAPRTPSRPPPPRPDAVA